MKKIPDKIVKQIEVLAKSVISDLKKNGHVVPLEQDDGSLKFDNFIVKKHNNFFMITGRYNEVVADKINLVQTAVLLAHGLALGKILDPVLMKLDQDYGYRLFDEEVYSAAAKRKKNNIDQVVFYETRHQTARLKRVELKNQIMKSFLKLTSIR